MTAHSITRDDGTQHHSITRDEGGPPWDVASTAPITVGPGVTVTISMSTAAAGKTPEFVAASTGT